MNMIFFFNIQSATLPHSNSTFIHISNKLTQIFRMLFHSCSSQETFAEDKVYKTSSQRSMAFLLLVFNLI